MRAIILQALFTARGAGCVDYIYLCEREVVGSRQSPAQYYIMFQRLGKRQMSADETGSQREKELRQTVAQLRQQVEEEKSAKKRAQYEKVRKYMPTWS